MEIHLKVDVLNTYKSKILSTPLFIKRSESIGVGKYFDNQYPLLVDKDVQIKVYDKPFNTGVMGSTNRYISLTVTG